MVAAAPLASNGPTQYVVRVRTLAPLDEWRWYASAPVRK